MKVAFIFGKGIDGCGVTRGALIFEKYLNENGHTTMVVDFDNGQSFGRAKNSQWIGEVYKVNKAEPDVNNKIVNFVNSCDIAIFHSHPTRKQALFTDRYRRFLENIDSPIKVIHDHSIAKTNINAIPQACEIFSHADVAVIQSLDGFSKEAYTNFDQGLEDKLIENPIWIVPQDFDKFNKSFEDREDHLLYLGRMSPLKDPAMICRIQPHMKDWKLSIIGCENSISSVSMYSEDLSINPSPYVPAYRPMIYQHNLTKDGTYKLSEKEQAKDGKISSYDSYLYDWGMEQLGSCKASWCGYKLSNPDEYGTRMEYTMIESFLLTLPIINRHFAENAYAPDGRKWGDIYGPLISQAREEKELSETLLSMTKEEWNERTQACRKLIFDFNDIQTMGNKFLDTILAHGKRPKISAIDRISKYFPEAKDLREEGVTVMSSATGTLKEKKLIMVDGKQQEYKSKVSTLEEFF